jgi:hypothetical protein
MQPGAMPPVSKPGPMANRILPFFSVLFVALMMLGGCKKDDLVNSTCDEIDKLATEIVDTVKKGETPKDGVDAAQKLLDSKKGDLEPKMKELGELRGFQVSDEATARMTSTLMDAVGKVEGLKIDYLGESMSDKDLDAKIEKLTGDFSSLLTG